MMKNKKFQKMPKISLGQKHVFWSSQNAPKTLSCAFCSVFSQAWEPQLLPRFLRAPKHKFPLRFLGACETSVSTAFPEGRAKHRTDRVNSGWAKVGGPRQSSVGWPPKIACQGGEPLWKVTKNSPGAGANLEFVSSSFPLALHFSREKPPSFAELSSELFFSMVTESEEAFSDGGK